MDSKYFLEHILVPKDNEIDLDLDIFCIQLISNFIQ